MSRFQKATRQRLRLRMGLDGPSGSGKSVTALRFAQSLGKRVAVIDTESGSARKYCGVRFDEQSAPIEFDVLELTTFPPTEYTAAIEDAGRAGFDVLVIDSLSHAWEGKDGALEIVDRKGGNNFTAWKDVTPMHRRMVDAILTCPCHVICTMRSKTEYVLEQDSRGKMVPRKVGMAPVQRPGMEYEFDIYGSLDWSHTLTITKSRCPSIDGIVVVKPGPLFMAPVLDWLNLGQSTETNGTAPAISDEDAAHVRELFRQTKVQAKPLLAKYGAKRITQLTVENAQRVISELQQHLPQRQPGEDEEEPADAGEFQHAGH